MHFIHSFLLFLLFYIYIKISTESSMQIYFFGSSMCFEIFSYIISPTFETSTSLKERHLE